MRMNSTKYWQKKNTSRAKKNFILVPVKISAEKRVDDVYLQIATRNEYSNDHTGYHRPGYHRQVTGKVYQKKKLAAGR